MPTRPAHRASRGEGKVLSCLLIVLIALAFLAALILAAETEDVSDAYHEESSATDVPDALYTWRYSGTKLTIYSDTDVNMPDFLPDLRSPFYPDYKIYADDENYRHYYQLPVGEGWNYITEIEIKGSIQHISQYAFCNAPRVTKVTIGDSVKSIGEYAFQNCPNLKSVTIGDSVKSIGEYAFKGCSSLKSVNIPDSVEHIKSGTFKGCSSLKSVNIPDSVERIGYGAFWNCTSLTSVNIPDSVTFIGDGAFAACTSLKSVNIPDSVIGISDAAFYGCSALTSVNIPNSVTVIRDNAFEGCTSLNTVYYNASGLALNPADGCWPSSGDILFIDANGGYVAGGAMDPGDRAVPYIDDSVLPNGFMRYSTAKDGTGTTYMPGDDYGLEGK